MLRVERALGIMTIWLAAGGTVLITSIAVALMLLEMRFNPGGTLILIALIINVLAIRFFLRQHLTACSVASLLGLALSIVGLLCIVAMTITSVGLLLLPAALTSLGMLAVALANQMKSALHHI